MSEVTPVMFPWPPTLCALDHAAVLRGPGLGSRDTARCQDNQQHTVTETRDALRGGMDVI